MSGRTKAGFYSLWTIAILVCLAVSIFVLLYTSFTGGGSSPVEGAPSDNAPIEDTEPEDLSPPDSEQDAMDGLAFVINGSAYSFL